MGAVSRLRAGRSAALGIAGERAAADLLRSRGFGIVGAGFLARRGELDLVCRRGDTLFVVEVKARSSDSFGTALAAVDGRKRQALKAAAAEYRALAEWRGPIRYLVVCVAPREDGGFDAELIEEPFG
ncbi:MAG TPA: YraN family protein [Candidatus Dormibacteraeota bacterium]|nr:YraN family protein [Candidatus Dormibacteraeota bacterium]